MDISNEFKSDINEFVFKFHTMEKLYIKAFFSLTKGLCLYPGQPPILMALLKHNECTQKELCKIINIKPGSMTDILQRMEKAELIERKPDENDLRVTRVYISKKGRNIVKKALQIGKEMEESCFCEISNNEREQFIITMDKICNNLSKKFDNVL